jgi:hypothetical protein
MVLKQNRLPSFAPSISELAQTLAHERMVRSNQDER